MTPVVFHDDTILPGLRLMDEVLVPGRDFASPEARILLVAIAGQESALKARRQVGGPARGFWQFEEHGGVVGVLSHPSTGASARAICAALNIPSDRPTVYEAIAWNDYLALAMARLLLWSDPSPLPAAGQPDAAYAYYKNLWRPGKEHPETWADNYARAVTTVAGPATRPVLIAPGTTPKP